MPPAEVVVYDFDGTLVEGDIGAAFVHHLLQGWRGVVALPIAPLGLALMQPMRTRRLGVDIFFRIASLGRNLAEIDALAKQFAEARPLRFRQRELNWLAEDLAAGHRVVIATGAFETLARVALRRLGLEDQVVLVASRLTSSALGARVERHCNGDSKVSALADAGFAPPYAKAVSDSWADAPLLCASREPVMVNASPKSRLLLRRLVGSRLIDADAPLRASSPDAAPNLH